MGKLTRKKRRTSTRNPQLQRYWGVECDHIPIRQPFNNMSRAKGSWDMIWYDLIFAMSIRTRHTSCESWLVLLGSKQGEWLQLFVCIYFCGVCTSVPHLLLKMLLCRVVSGPRQWRGRLARSLRSITIDWLWIFTPTRELQRKLQSSNRRDLGTRLQVYPPRSLKAP